MTDIKDYDKYLMYVNINGEEKYKYPPVLHGVYILDSEKETFNSPITSIGRRVTSLLDAFSNCPVFNQPVPINAGAPIDNMTRAFAYCPNFNQPVTIPTRTRWCLSTFFNDYNFNSEITLDANNSKLDQASEMFSHTAYNRPFIIPNTVTNTFLMFAHTTAFNQPITIPGNVEDMRQMFADSPMNSPITFGEGKPNCYQLLYGAFNFNQPITIPNTSNAMYFLFAAYNFDADLTISSDVGGDLTKAVGNCNNFNHPVTIPDMASPTTAFGMFQYDKLLNSPISIGNNITNCRNIFYQCSNLNSKITFGEDVDTLYQAFCYCNAFNQPVTLPNKVISTVGAFFRANSFNQPVTIPANTTQLAQTFYYASGFNSQVTFEPRNDSAIISMYFFLGYASSFNQPFNFPDNVLNCCRLFAGCNNFNQPLNFPKTATDMSYILQFCNSFNSPLHFTVPDKGVTANVCWGLHNCRNFNAPIYVEEGEGILDIMYLCPNTIFNSDISLANGVRNMQSFFPASYQRPFNLVIPATVNDLSFAMQRCASTAHGDIYFNHMERNELNYTYMLRYRYSGADSYPQLNIYCNNIEVIAWNATNYINNSWDYGTFTGRTEYVETTNGYYLESGNLYLWNNYVPGKGPIDNGVFTWSGESAAEYMQGGEDENG